MRVLSKYVLLQIPEAVLIAIVLWTLHTWDVVSAGLAIGAFAAWLAKDVILYPLVRHAYDPSPTGIAGAERLIDAQGTATESLDPDGYVRVRGELWLAEARGRPIEAGATIRVFALRGLTLIVQASGTPTPPPG